MRLLCVYWPIASVLAALLYNAIKHTYIAVQVKAMARRVA
jgi:hypothetical protein